MMQGRFHYYEGHPIQKVVYPVKVFKKLGVKTLIVTNAAGGINRTFNASDLMLITDHINFMHVNPLIGPNDEELGPRFPDMTEVYKKDLQEIAMTAAKKLDINLKKGVYMALTGPNYETPSETKMVELLGGRRSWYVDCSRSDDCKLLWHEGFRYQLYFKRSSWYYR